MKKFSIRERIKSFTYAFQGILLLFKYEHNAWIHGGMALIAIALGFLLNINPLEWITIVLCIALVLAAEAFNTALEKISDYIQPNQNKNIEHIKDLSAGAVLLIAIATLVVGFIVFLPKIFTLINS